MRAIQDSTAGSERFVAEVLLGGMLIHDVTITPEIEPVKAAAGQLHQELKGVALKGFLASRSEVMQQWRLDPATRFPLRFRAGGTLWECEVEIEAVVHGRAPKGYVEFYAYSVRAPVPAAP